MQAHSPWASLSQSLSVGSVGQIPQSRGMASPGVTLQRRCLSLRSSGVRARRADGAKTWSRVLSELAQGNVSVEWERTDVAPGVLEGRPDPRHAAARPQ